MLENTAVRTVTELPATIAKTERDVRKRTLNAAAYCRVSTDSDEQLNSFKSQIDYYTGIIGENPNWKFAGIFADEGLSAVSTKHRVEFNKMIRKCKAGRIDLIITKSVSRFARNTLDSISYARMLKKLGIGIIFEKEGVNTLEMDDEILLTIFSSLAQAESESLSKNVAMGFRQAFKAGKAVIHYDGFLGYRKGSDGNAEIVPEEAAVVRRIFHRYLAGESISQIKRDLESDRVPTARGKTNWSEAVLRYMLHNEKYVGDVLLQKTYVADVLTKQSKKNNGEFPQYYISNNHPAIIDRDIYNKVQEEIARRAVKLKTPSRTAKTEQSKYSGKYALNEVLVCGECGTPYRRATWTQDNAGESPVTHRAVWRCISRLEHGKQFCKNSPTLDEIALQAAITDALSEFVSRQTVANALNSCISAAQSSDAPRLAYLAAKQKLTELDAQFNELLAVAGKADDDIDYISGKIRAISEEIEENQSIVTEYEAAHDNTREQYSELLSDRTFTITQYDESLARQLIDTIRVQADGVLQITLKGGEQLERQVPTKRSELRQSAGLQFASL